MFNPMGLTQFGQWLAEQQGNLVKSLEQKQVQESLYRTYANP